MSKSADVTTEAILLAYNCGYTCFLVSYSPTHVEKPIKISESRFLSGENQDLRTMIIQVLSSFDIFIIYRENIIDQSLFDLYSCSSLKKKTKATSYGSVYVDIGLR